MDCLKIGCAFGAGMGRQQFTCGAVTGALMAIGLRFGKASGDSEDKKQETYFKTREFFAEFNKIHGSTICRELLKGLDMNDPDDYKKITEQDLFAIQCEKYVGDAVRIVEEIQKQHDPSEMEHPLKIGLQRPHSVRGESLSDRPDRET